jgi:chromosome segregation ATPase
MKTFKFYAIIAAILFGTASCVENSSKYKAVVAQRDSLALIKQTLDSSYNQTLGIVNDIENGFSEITQTQMDMKVNLKGAETKSANKKEQIAAQMASIKQGIEQNKAKIAELRKLASKKGKENTKLIETIKHLQAEMDEKTAQIQSLQTELEQKNIKITELSSTVSVQSKNIADQQNVLEQQKSTIKVQDTDLNSVWYCVATSKKLKDAKILTNTGLFQSKKVLATDFDKSAFTQIDLRNVTSIPTNSKNAKIISSHPIGSYNLVPSDDKLITIEITNPSKFWSVSKYLVVQI